MCERCAELERELEDLRYRLGIAEDARLEAALRVLWKLGPTTVRLVVRLYAANGRVVSRAALGDELQEETESYSALSVHMHKARKALGREAILPAYGQGFALTPAGLERVKADIERAEFLKAWSA